MGVELFPSLFVLVNNQESISHLHHIKCFALYPLKGPRVLIQKVHGRLPNGLIRYHDIWIDLRFCDRVNIAISLEVLQYLISLIGVTALKGHRLDHEIIHDLAKQMFWYHQLFDFLFNAVYLELLLDLEESLAVYLFLTVVDRGDELALAGCRLKDGSAIYGLVFNLQSHPQLLCDLFALDRDQFLLLEPTHLLRAEDLNVDVLVIWLLEREERILVRHRTAKVECVQQRPYALVYQVQIGMLLCLAEFNLGLAAPEVGSKRLVVNFDGLLAVIQHHHILLILLESGGSA